MCRYFAKYLKGAESCPLSFATMQERWNSGDDWTLLWYGGSFIVSCSILGPTKMVLNGVKLYTNASTQEYETFHSVSNWGWRAISISKVKNKIVYSVNGFSAEKPFKELDPCMMEGIIVDRLVNLRLVSQFYSVGELTQMYYKAAGLLLVVR